MAVVKENPPVSPFAKGRLSARRSSKELSGFARNSSAQDGVRYDRMTSPFEKVLKGIWAIQRENE